MQGDKEKGSFPLWPDLPPPSPSSPPRWSPLCLSDIVPAGSAGRLPFTSPPTSMPLAFSYSAITMVTGYCGHACQAAMLLREDRHRWSSSHRQGNRVQNREFYPYNNNYLPNMDNFEETQVDGMPT